MVLIKRCMECGNRQRAINSTSSGGSSICQKCGSRNLWLDNEPKPKFRPLLSRNKINDEI